MANEKICALCAQTFEPAGREVLCVVCDTARRERIRRMVRFDEVRGSIKIALDRSREFADAYPDAASLVEETLTALQAVYPGLNTVRANLHRLDDEESQRIIAGRSNTDGA